LQAGPVAAIDMTGGPLPPVEDSGRVEDQNSRLGADSYEEFLPDLSCSKLLAHKRWLTLNLLQSTTNADVLENLVNAYGNRVPDFFRTLRKDGEDDVGDSDGDDGIEPETEADAESGGLTSGQQQQRRRRSRPRLRLCCRNCYCCSNNCSCSRSLSSHGKCS